MAERDKNRSCSPPVPGPSSGNTGAAAGGEMAAREERDRNPHTVESLAEVFRCFICMEKLRNAHLCPHWYVGLGLVAPNLYTENLKKSKNNRYSFLN